MVTFSQGRASTVRPTGEPWPPFTMVYEHATARNGLSSPTVIHLDYADRRHWQATVIADPSAPQSNGMRWIFDGNTMTYYDARYGQTRRSSYAADQQPLMDEWLGPGRLELIEQKPNARPIQRVGNTRALLIRAESVLDAQTGQSLPWRQEITFREGDRIPLTMMEYRGGQLIERWEVRSLDTKPR